VPFPDLGTGRALSRVTYSKHSSRHRNANDSLSCKLFFSHIKY